MGTPNYGIPVKLISQWPDILIRSGCNVRERTLNERETAIVANPRHLTQLRVFDIELCSELVTLLMIDGHSHRTFSVIASGTSMSRELQCCVIAQMIAAGGVHGGGPDVFRGAFLWTGVQLDALQVRQILRSAIKKESPELLWEWPSVTASGESGIVSQSFKCLKMRCGRTVIRMWTGIGLEREPFFAFRAERQLLGKGIQRHIEDAIQEALLQCGGRVVPLLEWEDLSKEEKEAFEKDFHKQKEGTGPRKRDGHIYRTEP